MLVEIAFTFCLTTAPADCRIETRSFDGSMIACSLYGQQAAQEWLSFHPKWRLSRWRCGMIDPSRAAEAI